MCYDIHIISQLIFILYLYYFVCENMEKQSVILRFPKILLDRMDTYKKKKGFGTRTQTIFHLLKIALEQSDNRDSK